MLKMGYKISELRKKKGLTQSELSSLMGVSPQAVSKWESGNSYPDISVLVMLAKELETTTDYLLGKEDSPEIILSKEENRKSIEDIIVKIRIIDEGDKISMNLPLAFIQMGLDMSKTLKLNNIDISKAISSIDMDMVVSLAEKGVLGKFIEIEGDNGEQISISIE